MSRPTRIDIRLSHLEHNLTVAKQCAPTSQIVSCIKADAYGHGAELVAKHLDGKTDLFGVACLDEAVALDHLKLQTPFLLMEGCFDRSEYEEAVARGYEVVLHRDDQLEWALTHRAPDLRLWIKLETGMHRLGFPAHRASEIYRKLSAHYPSERLVLMSHFASAEEPETTTTDAQLSAFEQAAQGLICQRSLANSAAILARPDAHHDLVRPGFMLYGNSPFAGESPADRRLKPVMHFSSRVMALHQLNPGEGVGYNLRWRAERPSRIAVVAAGYGDGYPRSARDGTPVLVSGQRAALVGTVSMDMLTLDVTDLPNICVGDPVELWGDNLAATEVAKFNSMSAYELFTRIPPRPARRLIL